METANDRFSMIAERHVVSDVVFGALRIIWTFIRIPVLIVLAFLEPFVQFILTGIAILCVLTALVSKGSSGL